MVTGPPTVGLCGSHSRRGFTVEAVLVEATVTMRRTGWDSM